MLFNALFQREEGKIRNPYAMEKLVSSCFIQSDQRQWNKKYEFKSKSKFEIVDEFLFTNSYKHCYNLECNYLFSFDPSLKISSVIFNSYANEFLVFSNSKNYLHRFQFTKYYKINLIQSIKLSQTTKFHSHFCWNQMCNTFYFISLENPKHKPFELILFSLHPFQFVAKMQIPRSASLIPGKKGIADSICIVHNILYVHYKQLELIKCFNFLKLLQDCCLVSSNGIDLSSQTEIPINYQLPTSLQQLEPYFLYQIEGAKELQVSISEFSPFLIKKKNRNLFDVMHLETKLIVQHINFSAASQQDLEEGIVEFYDKQNRIAVVHNSSNAFTCYSLNKQNTEFNFKIDTHQMQTLSPMSEINSSTKQMPKEELTSGTRKVKRVDYSKFFHTFSEIKYDYDPTLNLLCFLKQGVLYFFNNATGLLVRKMQLTNFWNSKLESSVLDCDFAFYGAGLLITYSTQVKDQTNYFVWFDLQSVS